MKKLLFTFTILFLTFGMAWGEPGLSEAYKLQLEGMKGGDWTSIIKKLQVMSDKGDSDASLSLGDIYNHGISGAIKDHKAAAKWYRLSVDQGNKFSCIMLGSMYEEGEGVTQDYKEAMKLYKLAISREGIAGYVFVGDMYKNGKGVTQDYKEAMKWYQLAADKGFENGYLQLGVMYYKGEGVARDYEEALKWFRLAAKKDWQVDAQHYLGVMYYKGEGVVRDYQEALKWFRLAANRYTPDSEYYLGVMYANGHGVTQDHEEARKWYQFAADHGNVAAKIALNSMPYVKTDSTKRTTTIAPEFKPGDLRRMLKGEGEFAPIPNKLATLNCTLNLINNTVQERGVTIDYTNMMVDGFEAKFYENEIRWTQNSLKFFLNRLSGFISIDGKENIATGHCVPAVKKF